jgi:putative tryptophan/tyrosine transport system substrate-binding protein
MRRRDFIATIGGSAAALFPSSTRAQPARVRRIGRLYFTSEGDSVAKAGTAAFVEQLNKLGLHQDAQFRIDERFAAGDPGRLAALAKGLVRLAPDVIVSRGTPATRQLLSEMRTIPIVFVSVSDPVGSRFVSSIARPGGNATGFTNLEAGMGGKWLELLKEVAPRTRSVAALFNPDVAAAGGEFYLRAISHAAPSFGMTVNPIEVRSIADIERGLEVLAQTTDSGLVGMPDPFVVANGATVLKLAAHYRLPAVYGFRNLAVEGGLMSYGVDIVDSDRQAAAYVDRILKGASPGDLPVQAPVKFELVVNLKAAKAIGLDIPAAFLLRADEVIE